MDHAHAKHKRTAPEIAAWTAWQEQRAPDIRIRVNFSTACTRAARQAHGHCDLV